MKLTPLDIHHKEFRHSLRGYNEEQVDGFLDEVADEFERLFKENIDLSEKLEAADERVRGYQAMEATLNNTLRRGAALRRGDRRTRRALEADAMLRDAELKAKEIIHNALQKKQTVANELVRIKQAEEEFRARYKALLEGQLRDRQRDRASRRRERAARTTDRRHGRRRPTYGPTRRNGVRVAAASAAQRPRLRRAGARSPSRSSRAAAEPPRAGSQSAEPSQAHGDAAGRAAGVRVRLERLARRGRGARARRRTRSSSSSRASSSFLASMSSASARTTPTSRRSTRLAWRRSPFTSPPKSGRDEVVGWRGSELVGAGDRGTRGRQGERRGVQGGRRGAATSRSPRCAWCGARRRGTRCSRLTGVARTRTQRCVRRAGRGAVLVAACDGTRGDVDGRAATGTSAITRDRRDGGAHVSRLPVQAGLRARHSGFPTTSTSTIAAFLCLVGCGDQRPRPDAPCRARSVTSWRSSISCDQLRRADASPTSPRPTAFDRLLGWA